MRVIIDHLLYYIGQILKTFKVLNNVDVEVEEYKEQNENSYDQQPQYVQDV